MRHGLLTTATAKHPFIASADTRDRRLWLALGASALAHAVALAIFAGLLLPSPVPVWVRMGQPAVVQVLLAEPEPAKVAPQAETPVEVAKIPPEIEPTIAPLPVPAPAPTAPDLPASARRIDPEPPATPATGAATPTEPLPDAVPDDFPIPPGDVAIGAAESPEALGTTQALRLAQRFPQKVALKPRLQKPLVVLYPPRAARAFREARVSALLVIDDDGKVLETTLLPDEPLFGPTVRDALASAKFLAAEAESRPVAYWVVLEFVFTMRPTHAAKRPVSR
jgi:Gram-negative bacterial TonB protein C-terminal